MGLKQTHKVATLSTLVSYLRRISICLYSSPAQPILENHDETVLLLSDDLRTTRLQRHAVRRATLRHARHSGKGSITVDQRGALHTCGGWHIRRHRYHHGVRASCRSSQCPARQALLAVHEAVPEGFIGTLSVATLSSGDMRMARLHARHAGRRGATRLSRQRRAPRARRARCRAPSVGS